MLQEIQQVIKTLNAGNIILYPTDTIWGLGCDATNPDAVEKIFKLKQRNDSMALIILVDSINTVYSYVDTVPDVALQLIEFADKPLTIIYEKARNLAPNLIAADGSVAIRVTTDPFCKLLIQRFRRPIVSTSANISGLPAPAIFTAVDPAISSHVDYIVQHRQSDHSQAKPSSIIKLSNSGVFKIIR
jgi:L-threonylcarbamoyladenylate synthase